jgi:hypothetical protein
MTNSTPPEPGAVQQVIAEMRDCAAAWMSDNKAGSRAIGKCLNSWCDRLAALSVPSGGESKLIAYDVIQACADYLQRNYAGDCDECATALRTQHWGPVLPAATRSTAPSNEAPQSCHHCNEPMPNGRCWWCGDTTSGPAQADPAVARNTEPAPAVVAPEALSPRASGGSPDLREWVQHKPECRKSAYARDPMQWGLVKSEELLRVPCSCGLDAVLSSVPSSRGEKNKSEKSRRDGEA